MEAETKTENNQHNNVHEAITAIMAEIGGVAKGRTNDFQKYKYRGIADVYLACQPLMAKHGLHVYPLRITDTVFHETGKGKHVTFITTYSVSHVSQTAIELQAFCEAADTGDKAMNKAMSAGMKYCLVQLFALPEEDPTIDTEHETGELPPAGKPLPMSKQVKREPKPEDATPEAAKPLPIPQDILKGIAQNALHAGITAKELPFYLGTVLSRAIKSSADLRIADIPLIEKAIDERIAAQIASEES
jgi:hypothetical protein